MKMEVCKFSLKLEDHFQDLRAYLRGSNVTIVTLATTKDVGILFLVSVVRHTMFGFPFLCFQRQLLELFGTCKKNKGFTFTWIGLWSNAFFLATSFLHLNDKKGIRVNHVARARVLEKMRKENQRSSDAAWWKKYVIPGRKAREYHFDSPRIR